MNITRIDLWTALLALLFSSAVLTGCDTERFNDPGCASDLECRGERICDGNRCIHPDGLSPEPDDPDEPDAIIVDVRDLLGSWDMLANGTIRQQGEPDTLQDEPTPVLIVEGDQADIEVILGGGEGNCGLGANLTDDGFEFEPSGCEMDVDTGQHISYYDVEGTGVLNDNGVLRFDLRANVSASGPDMPEIDADMDVVLEGTRVDEMP